MVVDQIGLAALCDLLSSLSGTSLDEQQQSQVQTMIVTARRGDQIGQRLTDLAAQLGIRLAVGNLRGTDPARLAGLRGHPPTEIYCCPTRECGRQWVRRPGCDVPLCPINGQRLSEPRP